MERVSSSDVRASLASQGYPLPMTIHNVPVLADVDDTARIMDMVERKGLDFLHAPFPGEPVGMEPSMRPALWSMRLLHEKNIEVLAERRSDNLDMKANTIISVGILATIVSMFLSGNTCYSYLYSIRDGSFLGCAAFFMSLLIPGSVGIFSTYHLSNIPNRVIQRLKSVTSQISRTWPRKLLSVLQSTDEAKVGLSLELQALRLVLERMHSGDGTMGEKNWMSLHIGDEIAMIALTQSLERGIGNTLRGSQLGLSGENSELVHRACAQAFPGKMENLLDQLQNPSLVKV